MTNVERCLTAVIIIYGLFCGVVLSEENCDEALKEANIVPDYANRVRSTDLLICNDYTELRCGEKYSHSLLEKRPTCYYDVQGSCKYATLLLLGKLSDERNTTLQWLSYNIPADDLKNGYHGQSGTEVVIYRIPPHLQEPALHVFFVYCQPQMFNGFKMQNKDNVNVKNLTARNNLEDPEAALFIRVTAVGQLMEDSSYTEANRKNCPR